MVACAAGTAEARFGFLPVTGQQDPHAQQPDPAQALEPLPLPAVPRLSHIVSQVAVPLGSNANEHQILPGTVTVSPDSSNVAYKLRYGTGLGFDGYIFGGSNPIGTKRTSGPTFTIDSKSVAAVMIDRGWRLRHGRTILQGYEPVTPPRFSPDGSRIVYMARHENKRFMVEWDQPHTMADSLGWDDLVFTPDSLVMAYPAFDGMHWRMVINGDPGPNWDSFTTPPLTAENGSRVLYIATKNGQYYVVDRHTPAAYDKHGNLAGGFRLIDRPPVISANGRAFVYWALGDDMVWRIYQNHVYVPGYDAQRPGKIVISEDGQTLAAVLKRDQHWHVVQNAQPSPPYTAIGKNSLKLSPDGERLTYAVKKQLGWAVVENGTEHPTYTAVAANSLRFSPDSQRLVYAALSQGRWSIIENPNDTLTTKAPSSSDSASNHPRFNKIITRSITFSPDSQHLAYIGYNADAYVVRNARVLGAYERALKLTFGPNSRHLVWLATHDNQSFLVANGSPSRITFDQLVPGADIHFVNNLVCHTVVIRQPSPSFARVELRLSVPEQVPLFQQYDTTHPDTSPPSPPQAEPEPVSPFVEVQTE